ncbi:hypothetical protein IW261DRAFT_1522187, partial [Armillaria novae-zelandiae]
MIAAFGELIGMKWRSSTRTCRMHLADYYWVPLLPYKSHCRAPERALERRRRVAHHYAIFFCLTPASITVSAFWRRVSAYCRGYHGLPPVSLGFHGSYLPVIFAIPRFHRFFMGLFLHLHTG